MRRLATIRKIDEINPIEGADAIEVATVGGWKVVVKKGEYSAGDLAVYFEIDSWIPYELAPFLSNPDRGPREFEGVKGERLRTIKLRGQISQGLLLPITTLKSFITEYQQYHDLIEDDDVTDILGILKYERPMNAQLAGMAKGNFPSFIPKTDEERVQNLKKQLEKWKDTNETFEVTEKYDGSSMTVFFRDNALDEDGNIIDEFGVCSRNLQLKETEGNSFWEAANKLQLREKMSWIKRNFAIQGELVGEGIQGNKYKLVGREFFVFRMYDIDAGKYLLDGARKELCEILGLRHVAPLGYITFNEFTSIDGLLEFAEGKSVLNAKTEREGVVFKNTVNPELHFKAISNRFLLKNGDE